MGIQIRGAALPIAKVSIRPANGPKYTNLKREDFNYFMAPSGVGAGPFVVLVRYQVSSELGDHRLKLISALDPNAQIGSKQIIKGVKLNSVIGDA